MEIMEIDIITGLEYSIMRKGVVESIYDGESLNVDAFGTCGIKDGKIAVIFDISISHEDIKKVTENKLFLEKVYFEIKIDSKRKTKDDFSGTILDGLLWIAHHEKSLNYDL